MGIVGWKEDWQAEAVLKRLGVSFEYRTLTNRQIDKSRSRRNTARLIGSGGIIPDNVERFADDMRAGDSFPALVACLYSHDLYALLGGNNRHESAIIVGETEFLCIVADGINASDAMAELIARTLNTVNGQPQSREDTVIFAADACQKNSMTAKDASELFRVSVQSVHNEIRRREFVRDMSKRGVDASPLPITSVVELSRIPNENIAAAATSKAKSMKLPATVVTDLCREIRRGRTEAAQQEILTQFVLERQQDGSKPVRPYRQEVRSKFLRFFGGLDKSINGHETPAQVQLEDRELPELRRRWKTLRTKLNKILGA